MIPSFIAFLREAANQFMVHTTKNWTKTLKNYPQAKAHVDELTSILSKPRTQHTSEERQRLQTRFNEHPLKTATSRVEQSTFNTVTKDHTIYRYHLPGAKGLSSGRLTLNVAYHNKHEGAILLSVTEHQ